MAAPVALPMRQAPLSHFLELHRRQRWRAMQIDLSADAAAWPSLDPATRDRLGALVAGFCVAEAAVAEYLEPFGASASEQEAACFAAQAAEEVEHAIFFSRVAGEVVGLATDRDRGTQRSSRVVRFEARRDDGAGRPGSDSDRSAPLGGPPVRSTCSPALLTLFEHMLPRVAGELAAGGVELDEAVGLYHLVLEGVVFAAGQQALAEALEPVADRLPGVHQGSELVARDEKWHIGFGVRCLRVRPPRPAVLEAIAAQGRDAVDAWGDVLDQPARTRVAEVHERRMRAAGLAARAR